MPAPTIKFEHLTSLTREQLDAHPVHRNLAEALERWRQCHLDLSEYLFTHSGNEMRMFVFAKKLPFGMYDVKTYAFPVEHDFVEAAGHHINFPGTEEARRRIANLRKLKRGDEVVDATLAYLKVTKPDTHWELTCTGDELTEAWGLEKAAPQTPRKVGHLTVIK